VYFLFTLVVVTNCIYFVLHVQPDLVIYIKILGGPVSHWVLSLYDLAVVLRANCSVYVLMLILHYCLSKVSCKFTA
jgi:hypothetical protein